MKKNAFAVLCLCLLCGMLLAGCFGADEPAKEESGGVDAEGIYYLYAGGKTVRDSYVQLEGDLCTMKDGGTTVKGTYTIEDGRLRIKYTVKEGDEQGKLLIDRFGAEVGQTVEILGGTIGDGKLTLDTLMGETQASERIFYLEGKAPDANGSGESAGEPSGEGAEAVPSAFNGTYYFYEEGSFDRQSGISLEDGRCSFTNDGVRREGTYTIQEGKIVIFHTVDESNRLDQMLIRQYGVDHGETVELYGGYIETGMILINRMMGKPQSPDAVFYLEGRLPGAADGAVSAYNGTYYAEGDESTYIRLTDGEWLVVSSGEQMVGTYTVSGGRLTLTHTVDDSSELDRSIMEKFHLKDGDTVELFAGTLLQDRILLDLLMGEAQSPAIEFHLVD